MFFQLISSPPHLVANASNMEQAYVLACYPGGRGQNGVALHLSTGVHLLIHHQVSIVQRYLKGKRIDQPHPVFVALSDCAMDSSRNGSDDNVPSDATKRGEQIGACFRDIMDQVRKVEQREGSKTTNSVTESSRTVLDGEEPEHERTENDAPIKELSTSTDNTQPSANVVQRRQEEAIDPSNRISPDATEAANGRKRRREEAVNPSNKQSSKTLSDIAQRQSPPSSSLNMINPIVSVVSNISNSSQLSHQTPQLAVTLPYWEEALQILLGECDVALLRRRVDRHAIEARQSALRMALAVRQHLRLCGDSNQSTEPTDDSGRSTREKLNDFILDQWESEMDYSRDRILAYLRGNENNLIPLNSVKDLTVKFQAWMATQLDLHVVKD